MKTKILNFLSWLGQGALNVLYAIVGSVVWAIAMLIAFLWPVLCVIVPEILQTLIAAWTAMHAADAFGYQIPFFGTYLVLGVLRWIFMGARSK